MGRQQDKALERAGLLNYQTKDLTREQIQQRYQNAGINVNEGWFSQTYAGRPSGGQPTQNPQGQPQQGGPQPPRKWGRVQGGTIPQGGQARPQTFTQPQEPPSTNTPSRGFGSPSTPINRMPNLPYEPTFGQDPNAIARAYQQLQTTPVDQLPPWLASQQEQIKQAYDWFKFRNGDKPWTEWKYLDPTDPGMDFLASIQGPQAGGNAATVFASNEHALRGEANWTDISPEERQAILSDPNFYHGEITKYPYWMQQQILADPSFNWDALPAWQRVYYSVSSNPAMMGATQGLVLGLGNPGGAVVGGILGWGAAKSGYDQTKEFWKQDNLVAGGFGLMNWFAEQAEKTVGMGVQIAGILTGNDPTFDPNKRNLSWDAGASTFEVLGPAIKEVWEDARSTSDTIQETGLKFSFLLGDMIWNPEKYKGKEIYIGSDQSVVIDQTIYERLAEARDRINNGEDYRVVMTEMQTGVIGQISDMAGQAIADPLNIAGKTSARIGGTIAEVSGNKVAAEAFSQAGGLTEAARRYQNIINSPGEAIKIDPNFKVNELGWLERTVAGLTSDGKIKAGLFSSAGDLLSYQKPKKNLMGFVQHMTTLDPQSRARVGQDLLLRNLGGVMSSYFQGTDVKGFSTWWKAFSNGDMKQSADLSAALANSPEFYTVLPAAKDFNIDGLVSAWEVSDARRQDVARLADILGENPMTLIDDLHKRGTAPEDFARIQERLQKAGTPEAKALLADIEAGRFTEAHLAEAVKAFGDGSIPFHPGQWFAMTLDAIKTHYDEWAVNNFKLDEESRKTLFRVSHVMKSAQSILLLGANPGYMISNVLPTMVTRAASGVYGYMTPHSIDTFMSRMGFDVDAGFQPNRLDEGVGPAGLTEQSTGRGTGSPDLIRQATQGKGWLTNVENAIGKVGRAMPFNKLSRVLEGYEGKQAFIIGIKKMWGESWIRGKGFREIPKGLQAELTRTVGPRAAEILYSAIEAGMSKQELDAIVAGRSADVKSRSLVNQAAQDLNMPASKAAVMLEQIGVLDALDSHLKGARTEGQIASAFERARRTSQDAIDAQAGRDAIAKAEHIANRLKVEGTKAFTDIVLDTEMQGIEQWMKHYENMGNVAEAMDSMPNPVTRSKVWSMAYAEDMASYRRYAAQRGATYIGVLKAVGLDTNPSGRGWLAAIADTDATIDKAYRTMRDLRDKHFQQWNGDWNNPRQKIERNQIETQIDKVWKDATAREVDNLKKMGDLLADQYKELFGVEAGEAARQAWDQITAFRQEMVKRRDDFRKLLEGMPAAERQIASKEFWGKTYKYMIVEMSRIKQEAIARLDRIARGKNGGDAAPTPTEPQDTPPGGAGPARIDERETLRQQAEAREQAARDHVQRVWDTAEPFGYTARDKFKLISSLNKYGDFEVTSYDDPRLTPEYVQSVLQKREEAKAQIKAQQEEVAIGNALNRVQQEFISKPRSELPPVLSDALLMEAQRISDVIAGGEAGRRLFDESGFIGAAASTYPKWYNDLQQSTHGKASLVKALDKIVKDAGLDKGKVVERVKEFLLMTLKYGDSETNNPPNLNVLKALGADEAVLQNAADNFNETMRTDFTVDELTREAWDTTPNYEGALGEITAFDEGRWVGDMLDAFENSDKVRIESLIDELPDDVLDQPATVAETYREYSDRVLSEVSARLKESEEAISIAENQVRAEQAVKEQQASGETAMTRQRFRETLTDVFGLDDNMANAVMDITDARANAYGNVDEWYRTRIADVVKAGDEIDLAQEAYHGSPYKFDKFTLDHIGSIELMNAGKYIDYSPRNNSLREEVRATISENLLIKEWEILEAFDKGGAPEARAKMKEIIEDQVNSYREEYQEAVPFAEAYLREVGKAKFDVIKDDGQLYKVDIPDENYLLWDKSLSEQPQSVKDALAKIDEEIATHFSRLADMRAAYLNSLSVESRPIAEKMLADDPVNLTNGTHDKDWARLQELDPGIDHNNIHDIVNALRREGTGKDIYESISSDPQSASLALKEAGINGIQYLNGSSRGKGEGSYNYVIFDDAAIQIKETFYQADTPTDGIKTQPKGGVQFLDDGRAIIRAFEKADVSTVVHEVGHIFRRDLAGVDLKVIEDWAGVKNGEWTVKAEEQFARGFEKYLADGSAPTPRLRAVFQKFKQWMTEIYRAITGSPIDVELTPQVKEVFDRLLVGERTSKVDVGDMLLQMGYDPKANYLDVDGSIKRRPELNIRVDPRQVGRDVDAVLSKDFQQKVKALHKDKPAGSTPDANVTAPKKGTPIWQMTEKEYIASLFADQKVKAEATSARIQNELKALEGRDEAWVAGERARLQEQLRKAETLLSRNTTSYELYGDTRQKYMDGIRRALEAGEQLRPDIRAAYEDMGTELGQLSFREVRKGMSPNVLFQDADPRMPLGGYEEAAGWMPQSEVMDEGWSSEVQPLLNRMREIAIQRLNEPKLDGAYRDLSPEGQKMLRQYMNGVKQDMAGTKQAALRWGANQRDYAMLNYNRRYGFDKWLDIAFPYQFFYTRSMMTWAMRALDTPAWLSNYARLRMQQEQYENNLPERLRGKMRIEAPWLPDWMGDAVYIDPLSVLFTPHNFLRPIEQMTKDQNMQTIEAERILQEWAADGTVSQEQIQEAAQTRSGSTWERALAEAKIRREAQISNPMDFVAATFGPAWYLSTPYKLATGKGDEITELPITKTARALDTVTQGTWAEPVGDILGLLAKPEEMARDALNLPQMGEYGDYYIDRQLANMVAEGLITSEQAQIAMIERQGQLFDEAKQRVELELAMRVPLAGTIYAGLHEGPAAGAQAFLPSLFGAGLLPEGELKFRGLKDEWNAAWKMKDAGDDEAINRFFEEHPEYEAYLAKGKPPEERLKSFLIGQIWDGYMALGDTDRKQATAAMGDLFKQAFLNSETRSYDTLDVNTLTTWAQMLNMMLPKTEETLSAIQSAPKINFYPQEVSAITDRFFQERKQLYPNYYMLEQGYYSLPPSKRAEYLLRFPQYKEFREWRKGYYNRYPELVPVFKGQVFKTVDTSQWPDGLEYFVQNYAYTGEDLPEGAYKALEQMWIREGRPMGDLQTWLDSQVAPAMLYQQGIVQ